MNNLSSVVAQKKKNNIRAYFKENLKHIFNLKADRISTKQEKDEILNVQHRTAEVNNPKTSSIGTVVLKIEERKDILLAELSYHGEIIGSSYDCVPDEYPPYFTIKLYIMRQSLRSNIEKNGYQNNKEEIIDRRETKRMRMASCN